MKKPKLARPFTCVVAVVFTFAALPGASAQKPVDNIGHERHLHKHNPKHPTVQSSQRFVTSRSGARLDLPNEKDAFFFAIFGDRTGGPAKGVSVLADAVHDVNLLEPDFVMTVGDLVEGYNRTGKWMRQMLEFRGIMDHLICPWFPVAGNHDIYWRGEGRPAGEHEASYEMHFGPLWYAFEHKNCWFIALYSDEGNPQTGEKNFGKAACQRMSPEQFEWLRRTLARAKKADHVFLFLHHPRWLGGRYGDDWEKVHEVLVSSGNVTAVFAGHIHYMRYDPRDGIDYVTLATTGGAQNGAVPKAGSLHHYHLVTVRKEQIAIAAVPVGEVMDVREITGEMVDEVRNLARLRPQLTNPISLRRDGSVEGMVTANVSNPSSRPVDVMITPQSDDRRWWFGLDHDHRVLGPGEEAEFTFEVRRTADAMDSDFRIPELSLRLEYLARGARYPIPPRGAELPLDVDFPSLAAADGEHVLALDGRGDALRLSSEDIVLPDGPMTLECWFEAHSYGDRVGLVTKTENSEYGIFVSKGKPGFSIHLDGEYVVVEAEKPMLETGRWHHVAGVFDGSQTRLYVDGKQIGAISRAGKRTTSSLPLFVGADVDSGGAPTSFFKGRIDEVRLSKAARYGGKRFKPSRRLASDDRTLLLLHMDQAYGPWTEDASPRDAHPRFVGDAEIEAVDDPSAGSSSGR